MSQTNPIILTLDQQQLITTEQAWHYGIVPKEVENGSMVFYVGDGRKVAKEELEILFGKSIVLEQVEEDILQSTLNKYYRKKSNGLTKKKKAITADRSDDFLESLIEEAKELESSDIHIEAYEEVCRVRFRIDGQLIERYTISRKDYPSLINKLKIKSNLDIAEKRLPQDGRIFFQKEDMKFDIRVSVLPTLHGEKVVMRLLSNDATDIDINALGFSDKALHDYMEGVRKPHGIVLISGPTGSGKTTTLYATLKVLNKTVSNIVTIEDPIEYTLEGINQVQLKENIGLSFASALRSFLRQDPDIIMLGEIRDGETAQMAIRAALTGHLVLSTIHTNSAWGTISRLIDMGVPAFLLANTLNASVAQRLVRTLCPHCKEEQKMDASIYPKKFKAYRKLETYFVPKGCDDCYQTGYKGRKAVHEVIPIDAELATKIKDNDYNINQELKQKEIKTLAENAFEVFAKGETSIDEVYPILMSG